MEHVDTLVIGAGVVGLACGALLSKSRHVVVIEQNSLFGEHTSSRNSEVIHAGIYYPPLSLKATLCTRGKTLLYKHLEQFNLPYQKIGKLIVATTLAESEQLDVIRRNAEANNVSDLHYLSAAQIAEKAPDLSVNAALYSPSTGILDSHQLMLSFIHEIEASHGIYVANTEFISAQKTSTGFRVTLLSGNEEFTLSCHHLVNCAGLFAQKVASQIDTMPKGNVPETHYCRGQYYKYQGKHPFSHLVYPIPEQHGLGIHATLDLAGQLKFGPDTEFVDSLDYSTDDSVKSMFVNAIKRYWPQLDANKLQLDYAGIRPKLSLDKQQDFMIQTHTEHGVTGLVNLFGIESPGLTASLAIAEHVENVLNNA
jgi:L-2-hydroxyglutarate oxidase LhgO